MKRPLVIASVSMMLLYVFVGLCLYLWQRSFIYFPTAAEPVSESLNSFTFENEGQTINIWSLNPGRKSALLYFGGNQETVSRNADNYARFLPEHSIYFLEYRGYGLSNGSPSEQGIYSDALKAFDLIAKDYAHIMVVGRSLGSGVATYIAAQRQVRGLVLVTPYDSILAIGQSQYPIYPISWMLIDTFDSLSRADMIDEPTLIILSEFDSVVPHKHAFKLAEALASREVVVKTIKDSNHISVVDNTEYFNELNIFLKNINVYQE